MTIARATPKCEIQSYAISTQPFGEAKTFTHCRTHNWPFAEDTIAVEGMLCPLGRIEQSAEDAVNRVESAIGQARITMEKLLMDAQPRNKNQSGMGD